MIQIFKRIKMEKGREERNWFILKKSPKKRQSVKLYSRAFTLRKLRFEKRTHARVVRRLFPFFLRHKF